MVIGGLILSTIMTLALVPAGFSLADDVEKWFGRKVGPRILSDYHSTGDKKSEPAIEKGDATDPFGGAAQPAE
jgi:hypothetical protein